MCWWLNGAVWTMMMMTISIISFVQADDPYRFFDWRVTYGNISPLGIPQRVFFFFFQHPQKWRDAFCFCLLDHACFIFYSYTQGILINGQYPGPDIYSVTNDNLIINVHNDLDEPFLLSWYHLSSSPSLPFSFIH